MRVRQVLTEQSPTRSVVEFTILIAMELIGTGGAFIVGNIAPSKQFDGQHWFFDCYDKYPSCEYVSGGDLLVGRLSRFCAYRC